MLCETYCTPSVAATIAQIRRVARTTKGIKGTLVRRLYVAVPKMMYTVDVWCTPIRDYIKGR